MTKRQTALALARVAGYHEDTEGYTRLYCESRVRRELMDEAFRNGRQARANGVKCSCRACNAGPGGAS